MCVFRLFSYFFWVFFTSFYICNKVCIVFTFLFFFVLCIQSFDCYLNWFIILLLEYFSFVFVSWRIFPCNNNNNSNMHFNGKMSVRLNAVAQYLAFIMHMNVCISSLFSSWFRPVLLIMKHGRCCCNDVLGVSFSHCS